MSGDGLIGQIGGALAGTDAPMGVIPGGRGNDFARVLGIPTEIPGAVALIAAGRRAAIDVGEVNGRRFLCIASCGFDSDANRIANETRFVQGQPRLPLRGAARAGGVEAGALQRRRSTASRASSPGTPSPPRTARPTGAACILAPDAELDDGKLDVVRIGDVSKLHFLANLPKVFKGRHVENEEVTVLRARRGRDHGRSAVRASTPTATTWPTCRRPFGCCRARST